MDDSFKIFIRDATVRDYGIVSELLTSAGFEVEIVSPFSKDRVPTASATKYLKIKKQNKKMILKITAVLLTVTSIAANVTTILSDQNPGEKVKIQVNNNNTYNVTITIDGSTHQFNERTLEEVQAEIDSLDLQ